jgi:hypothetical protein
MRYFCLDCGNYDEARQVDTPTPIDERPEAKDVCAECGSGELTDDVSQMLDFKNAEFEHEHSLHWQDHQELAKLKPELAQSTADAKMFKEQRDKVINDNLQLIDQINERG